jgi:hypothetical protein
LGLGPGGAAGGAAGGSSVGDASAAITGGQGSGSGGQGSGQGSGQAAGAAGQPAAGTGQAFGGYGAPGSGATGTQSNQAGGAAGVQPPDGYVIGQPPREVPPGQSNQRAPDGAQAWVPRPGEWEPTPDPPPKSPDDKDDPDQKDHKKPKPLANRRGEDWALRDSARGGIGLTRPIRVECYADHLTVISERGPANNRVVPLGSHTRTSIDAFVSALWEQIEAWGMAGRGMYWRPVLQVSVAPGGDRRFSDLEALLAGSGFTVKRK